MAIAPLWPHINYAGLQPEARPFPALFTEDTITGNLLPLPLWSKAATVLLETFFEHTTKLQQGKVANCAPQKDPSLCSVIFNFVTPCPSSNGNVVVERSHWMQLAGGLTSGRVPKRLKFEVKLWGSAARLSAYSHEVDTDSPALNQENCLGRDIRVCPWH